MDLQKYTRGNMFEFRPTAASAKTKGGVFGRGRILLGRAENCNFIINNEAVSAVHAVMEIFDDKAIIYDMNSTNGTFVNDDKVIVKELILGDTFRLGEVEFEFKNYSPEDLPPVLDTLDQIGRAHV